MRGLLSSFGRERADTFPATDMLSGQLWLDRFDQVACHASVPQELIEWCPTLALDDDMAPRVTNIHP